MVGVFAEAADPDMRNVNVPLNMAIQRALIDHNACFVTLSCSTCVIVKQGHHFAVFDPHMRNIQGHVDAEKGTAVVVFHSDFTTLYDQLENLAEQLLQGHAVCKMLLRGFPTLSSYNGGDSKPIKMISGDASVSCT